MAQKVSKSCKTSYSFNDFKRRKMILSCNKKAVDIPLEQKTNLNRIKRYVKIKTFVMKLCLLKALNY